MALKEEVVEDQVATQEWEEVAQEVLVIVMEAEGTLEWEWEEEVLEVPEVTQVGEEEDQEQVDQVDQVGLE